MAKNTVLIKCFDTVYKQNCLVSIQDIFQDDKRGGMRYEILEWNAYNTAIESIPESAKIITQDSSAPRIQSLIRALAKSQLD